MEKPARAEPLRVERSDCLAIAGGALDVAEENFLR
jgi:hypothetical protein